MTTNPAAPPLAERALLSALRGRLAVVWSSTAVFVLAVADFWPRAKALTCDGVQFADVGAMADLSAPVLSAGSDLIIAGLSAYAAAAAAWSWVRRAAIRPPN